MHRFWFFFLAVAFLSCKTTAFYISRHAEKAGAMSADPPLTAEGEKQAQDLGNYLTGKNIGAVYSTNYVRTIATAKPTATRYNLPVTSYNASQSAAFIDSLRMHNKQNILVVGHSNTVDDMVNRLTGKATLADLPETEYGSLYIVKKKGNRYRFERIIVPQTVSRP